MLRIKAPASSANLGPGFDCLGIGLNVYNTFEAELSATDLLENVEDRYNNADNLFLQAYRYGCEAIGVSDHVHVRFDCQIPSTRGMGSSAAFIAAGVTAASVLHNNALSREEIFQLITRMEGHPDNTAPCFYGGLCASLKASDGTWLTRKIPLHESWRFTLLVPDFEVSTREARRILPQSYSRADTSASLANAVMVTLALGSGDEGLLKEACNDVIHEPYRAALIDDFDFIRDTVSADTGGRLVISGSGPALLLISKRSLSKEACEKISGIKTHRWQIISAEAAQEGIIIEGDNL